MRRWGDFYFALDRDIVDACDICRAIEDAFATARYVAIDKRGPDQETPYSAALLPTAPPGAPSRIVTPLIPVVTGDAQLSDDLLSMPIEQPGRHKLWAIDKRLDGPTVSDLDVAFLADWTFNACDPNRGIPRLVGLMQATEEDVLELSQHYERYVNRRGKTLCRIRRGSGHSRVHDHTSTADRAEQGVLMIDCLFIGHNDGSFPDYVDLIKSIDTDPGAVRRLNLAYIDIDGVPHRGMDVLNRYNGRDGVARPKLSNLEAFSPTIAYLVSYVTRRGFSAGYVHLFQEEKAALARTLERERRAGRGDQHDALRRHVVDRRDRRVRPRAQPRHRDHRGRARTSTTSRSSPRRRSCTSCSTHIDADVFVISQEGELALTRVLEALRSGGSMAGIDNIAYRHEGAVYADRASVERNALADNMVDYDLFPPGSVGEFVSVRTSKSCPFACAFCSFPQQAGKYVYEGIDTVEMELDRIRRIGTVTSLAFIDDTFNVPMGRFKDILRMMIRNDYGFRWNSFLRADHVDDECIDLMRRSGCEGVFLGVESGSDAMLKRMNKTSRAAHYRRVIPQLQRRGHPHSLQPHHRVPWRDQGHRAGDRRPHRRGTPRDFQGPGVVLRSHDADLEESPRARPEGIRHSSGAIRPWTRTPSQPTSSKSCFLTIENSIWLPTARLRAAEPLSTCSARACPVTRS